MKQSRNPDGVADWLDSLVNGARLSARQQQVLTILQSQPRLASYGTVGDIARASTSNASTVTRTAQTLGFTGWAELQLELRSRFLASLSAVEVAAEHGASRGVSALSTDRANLAHLDRTLDPGVITQVAEAVAGARRTYVIAAGSYSIPGRALEHNAVIAGYDVRLLDADVAALSNAVAALGPEDVVIVISLWRVYDSTVRAADIAHRAGARIICIADTQGSAAAVHGSPRIIVPSEGAGFFPSLTPCLALVQAIAVELAGIDQARSRLSIANAERTWDQMRIMSRRT